MIVDVEQYTIGDDRESDAPDVGPAAATRKPDLLCGRAEEEVLHEQPSRTGHQLARDTLILCSVRYLSSFVGRHTVSALVVCSHTFCILSN